MLTAMTMTMTIEIHATGMLRLLQLSSSFCPIGAFAYSQGLESAIEQGWIRDETGLVTWLEGVGSHGLVRLDLPLLARAHSAWQRGDAEAALLIGERVASNREARELYEQDHQLGLALAALLVNLGVEPARAIRAHAAQGSATRSSGRLSYLVAYALGAVHFEISEGAALLGYSFAWAEQQVSAAARLVPLGHMAAQRALSEILTRVPSWVDASRGVRDDELGSSLPALSMAAAWHETQYTRLFRS